MKVVHEKKTQQQQQQQQQQNKETGILCFKKYVHSFFSSKFLLIRLFHGETYLQVGLYADNEMC